MPAWISSKTTKAAVFALSLLPLAHLLYGFWSNTLGANPIEYITRDTGTWTLRFVLFSLAITPARRIFQQPNLIVFRRMLGLFAFFYGCLHLMTWVWLDKFFDTREMVDDLVKRRFITMGMFGFVLMVPLAITSTKGWIRRLGKNWTRLHRLVYVTAIAGVIHYWWLVKSDIRLPLMYGVIAVVLLSLRLRKARRPVLAIS
jgi:sulfoxide reductase heme-binding subunit YedZ